ncbi:Prp18-domain-containing protein [Sanghuangporus baumii]|uniref:Pre-mRNA-splicing factor 18 n=1 Tax=Sanghuangporus baumii TaxID=108892 RepID=A0A9Q5HS11_SANBA|nr:Prp18-domain-containing protein [Sanghuangporus baumii]
MSLDALKAEIAGKRKPTADEVPRPTKYLRRGELEKLKAEQERKEKEEKEKQKRKQEQNEREVAEAKERIKTARAFSNSPVPESSASARSSASPTPETSGFNISSEEAIRRLRAKGQPIRLFGESDRERRLRLRALELIEEKGHDRHGGQNDFRKALENVEIKELEAKAKGKDVDTKSKEEADISGAALIDLELIKTDPDKLYPLIYYALKKTLREWAEYMDERPEYTKQTTQGKLAAATQVQSAQYLKPLFKSLRQRVGVHVLGQDDIILTAPAQNLPSDVLARVTEIVHYMQKRQYQKANDAYLRLSIGNAPWPIGVTMVGIHERSAREKISSDQVAHVLNDEVSRKYIQSLKRLLTFSQTKYPPEDLTQLMG